MSPIQILIIIFSLFALSRAILQIKNKGITLKEFLFWSILWSSLIIFSMLPDFSSFISRYVGIQRGVDFFIYIGVVVLFYFIFRMYVEIDKMKQEITSLTRIIAKDKAKKPENLKTNKK
jgi:small membrane protein